MTRLLHQTELTDIVQASSEPLQRHQRVFLWRGPPIVLKLMAFLASVVFMFCGPSTARADRNPPGCSGSGLGISLFTSLPDVHIGDTIFYSINVFNAAFPACDAGQTNGALAGAIRAYIVTPNGITNAIVLRRTFLVPGESDYYTNVVSYVVRSQDLRSDGTVRATASDQGDIHQNDSNSTGGGNQGVNTEVNLPCVLLSAVCTGGTGENGMITFTGTVTNCGNNTLVGITVTNFVNNGAVTVLFPTNLAIGQIARFSGSWIPLNPCSPSTAILTVRASDEFTTTPRVVTNFTTIVCQNVLTPGIKVTKTCPVTPVAPGQLLTFSGTVSNTGNITLTNIVVVNNQSAANTPVFTLASLAPGVSANFTGSYTAPTNCSVSDTLIATAASICGGLVTNSATANCPIFTSPFIMVTAVCPPKSVVPGGLLTYTGTVQNMGNITLTNVVLVSDRPASNSVILTVATLAPGAITNFTASYVAAADTCTVATTFRATGSDICTAIVVTNTATTTCTVTMASAITVSLACPVAPSTTGGLITYSGTVSNSGNVTLNNVYVVNNQPAVNTAVIGPITLLPGAAQNFTTSFTTPADSCLVASMVTATGRDNCSASVVTNTATATCSLTTTPAILVTQVCPINAAVPGGLLTYSGTVKNTGNITLTNVVVLNNLSGNTPIFTATSLAPGATGNFTGSYLAPTNCSSTSISIATGRSICGVAVTNSVTSTCTILTAPAIKVTAFCPVISIVPGGLLTYSGTVQNMGNITLTNVVLVSDRPASNSVVLTVLTLAPGASTNFTASYTVAADTCTVTTTFKVTGGDICTAAVVTNTASTTCTVSMAPAISVSLTCPVAPALAGGLITYSGTVSNSGNVTLNNVYVVNNQPSLNTAVIGPISLAPGATRNFTASFTAPVDACLVGSTVIATGTDNCSAAMVTNTASASCSLVTAPAILVTQACPVKPAVPGGLLTYTGTVKNSGNITLTNVVVLNNLSGSTPVFTTNRLAPGATGTFTGSYLAPTNCLSTSLSIATGRSICGVAVTNSVTSTCTILTAPSIAVTQACPITPVVQGGILTYSGTVSNSGNITLTNVIVVNNWPAANTVIFTLDSLAPGAMTNFTGSYVVPLNCCVAWSTVQARGQGCDGVIVRDTDSGTCTVFTSPALVVTKVCPPTAVKPGEMMHYSGTVSNAGNITLINVTVVSTETGTGLPFLGPIALAPGEVVPYDGSYIVPADFCGTDTVTASALDSCSYMPVVSSVTVACPIDIVWAPRIAITKHCPSMPTPHGGQFVFTGSVSNLGNVTLVNVYVVDNMPSNNTPVIGPITLAPGTSVNFTGSYTAPLVCCEITDTLTARGQNRCTGSNVSATATAICPTLYTPGIAVVENWPSVALSMGSDYMFDGFVTNTGDAILTNVIVFTKQGGQTVTLLGPLDLAPGESEQYIGLLTVPFDACSITILATSQETCRGSWVTNSTVCPIATMPLIVVKQICPPNPVSPGGLLVYSGTVSNAGNVTLFNVVVTNSQSGSTPLVTIATLAPGTVTNYAGSYIAPVTGLASSVSTAHATSLCGEDVIGSATSTCLIVTVPSITVVKLCPTVPVAPGDRLVFSGTVSNTGNVTLTNVIVVDNQPAPNTPVLGPITLAPGASSNFTGGYIVSPDICSQSDTLTATGKDATTGVAVTNTASAICPILTTPAIVVSETCPAGTVSAGTQVVLGGVVSNTGNITLTNVLVYSSQALSNIPVLGPITLAPGASAPFSASYTALGGSNPLTNSTVTTNSSSVTRTNVASVITTNRDAVITTNLAIPTTFETIDSVSHTVVNRFGVGANYDGLAYKGMTYAGEDHGYGATEFYAMHKATNGTSFFDTIIPSTGVITDRLDASTRSFDALAYASVDLGYGPLLFYYLSHDSSGVSTFGSITPGGVVGVTADHFVVGSHFDALAFAATDLGYGANLFYYVRHDASGLSTFGTISPGLPGIVTDRFMVGTNVDSLVFTDLTSPGYGANKFYYVRHDTNGVSTFGTLAVTSLTTGMATDRFTVGSNVTDIAFTATDTGFGENKFYILRGRAKSTQTNIVTSYSTNVVITLTTNIVVTLTTNSVVTFTTTNTVTAMGVDICQARIVVAAANCLGPIPIDPAGPASEPTIGASRLENGLFNLAITTEIGKRYTVQYKNTLSDATWGDLEAVVGTGFAIPIVDASAGQQPTRFYRVIYTP